ncbi:MAG: PorV/PorQ family protein [bacterium]|nr:MAG: PorV/PorQ family protein [bacterium]
MKKFIILFVILLCSSFQIYAGDVSKIGTVSGTELLIPVGARSIALGGAVLSDVKGAEAIYWNPAGVAYSQKSEITFSNMSYIADIDVNYIAGTIRAGVVGTFGLHLKFLSFGDIEETTVNAPEGTGNTYSPSFSTFGLTFGRMLTDRITAGVTAKYIYEGIMQTSASTFAFDMGIQYAFNNNLRMGVTLLNLGGKLSFDGRNLEQPFQIPNAPPTAEDGYFRATPLSSNIPSTFSFGFSYSANINEMNGLRLTGAFSNFNESSDQLFGGMEYGFRQMFFLRGGYAYNVQESSDAIFGYSLGAGFHFPIGGFEFTLDYAFRDVTDYFDANNVFSITFGL